jgi:O-antigen/teichoic acid export membrane protein
MNIMLWRGVAVLLYLLLPRFGLMGAAIASAAAYFAELSLVVYGLRRKHSISPANLFRFRIADLKSFMASAVVGLRRNRLDYTAN